jgi:type I restriction enzyme S subunit
MTRAYPLVLLSNVLALDTSYIDKPEGKIYPKLSVRLYGKGVILDTPADGTLLKMKRHQVAKAGQVVLSEIWGKKGAIGFVPHDGDGALCTSHFFLFDVQADRVLPQYLQAIFAANYLEEQLNAEAKGSTGYAAVRPKHLLNASIPLPPFDEQRRIVTRIEQLSTKVEEARCLRRHAAEEVEQLKQSGTDRFFSCLDGARPTRIEETCEVRGGIQKSRERMPGANPRRYITVAHVQRNSISVGDPRYFEVSDEELERWRLLPGDVLVIEGNGSSAQIGRAALFGGEIEDCVHQNHVIRVRPSRDKLMPEFLNAYFNSPIGRGQMLERSRTTSGLFNLSVGRIKELEIPLPSLERQRRVVAEVGNLESTIGPLTKLQSETATELDALMPSILSKAFRGEL